MLRFSRPAAVVASAVVGLSFLTGSVAAASPSATSDMHKQGDHHHSRLLLKAPIQGSLVTDPTLFGAKPGGAPWVISRGKAKLDTRGRLDVVVRGLIIPTTGVNPVPTLAASVACNGEVVATTATVPFSTTGNARIKAKVALPSRCLAPAVLLNPNGISTTYIGITGH
jgi:hypothetical protein